MTIKKPAVLFLTIVLMLGMILAFPMPVKAAATQLNVGGGTYDPSTNPTGTGWAWEDSSKTLTLNSSYTGEPTTVTCNDPSDTVTVALAGNVSLTGISVNANLIIETNGYTLNVTVSSGDAIYASAGGNITIQSSSGTGTVNARSTINSAVFCNGGGKVTIESGAVLNASGGSGSMAVLSFSDTVVRAGGTLTTPTNDPGISGNINGPLTVSGGNVTIGGFVRALSGNAITVSSGNVALDHVYGDLTVTGGNVFIGGGLYGDLTMSAGAAPTGGIVDMPSYSTATTNVTAGTLRLGSLLSITDITPNGISTAGGESVTLTGRNLNNVTTLAVGGITIDPADITSQTATTLTFVAPSLPDGPVFVWLTNGSLVATSHHILSASASTPTPPPTPAPVAAGTSPQTGDPSNMLLWLTLVIISMGCIGAVLFRKRINS